MSRKQTIADVAIELMKKEDIQWIGMENFGLTQEVWEESFRRGIVKQIGSRGGRRRMHPINKLKVVCNALYRDERFEKHLIFCCGYAKKDIANMTIWTGQPNPQEKREHRETARKVLKCLNFLSDLKKSLYKETLALRAENEKLKEHRIFLEDVRSAQGKIILEQKTNIKNLQHDLEETAEYNRQLREENEKLKNNLPRALGIIQGSLHIKDMEEFDKKGLVSNLEEVKKILTEILNVEIV